MPFIQVGQENSSPIDLYYEDHGSGKPVVLIHGWPLSGASWEKQTFRLLEEGYRVITYDRRGFGKSSQPATGYDYDTFAEDLNRLMTRLELRDATLVGFSMGTGEVARYLGKYGSDRVEKAVFLASIPPFLLNGVNVGVFEEIKKKIRADRPKFLREFLFDFYNYDLLKDKRISPQAFRASWNVASSASAIATLNCVSTWTTDFREDLPKIDVPSLVIHGKADRILPYAVTGPRLNEALPGSRFVTLQDGPHGLLWTHAEEVNYELLSFLREKAVKRKVA